MCLAFHIHYLNLIFHILQQLGITITHPDGQGTENINKRLGQN